MKANRFALAKRDEAVSSVVSAVLIFGLFATVSVLYTINTLPEWVADNEQRHMELVKERLDLLKASLDTGSGSTAPAIATFPLGAEKVALLQPVAASGALSYSSGQSTAATFTAPAIFLSGGQVTASPTCVVGAAATASCPSLASVKSLSGLVVGLATTGVTLAADSAGVQVKVTDAKAQTVTFKVEHVGKGIAQSLGCPTTSSVTVAPLLRTSLSVGSGTAIVKLLQCGLDVTIPSSSPYLVDLLDSSTGVAAALGSLVTPYASVAITSLTAGAGAATGSVFAAVWTDSTGLDRTDGTGLTQTPAFSVSQPSGGALQFKASNQRYPSQTLSYEFGGIVRIQGDGQAIASGPGFNLSATAAGVGNLRWTLVNLAGSGSVGGSGDATAQLQRQSSSDILLTDSGGSGTAFTLTTTQGAAWSGYLKDRLKLAGVTGCDPVSTATTVTWTLNGCKVGSTTITGWIVRLNLVDAKVTVT